HPARRPRRVPPPLPRPHRQGDSRMNIAIVLYDRFTALDAVGPYEVLSRIPGAKLSFLAEQPGPVTTDNGILTVLVEHGLEELEHPDVVVVPGGPGEVDVRAGGRVLEWLR